MLIEKVELKKIIFNNGNSFMAKFMARQNSWQDNGKIICHSNIDRFNANVNYHALH